jgi:hypothetical protein
MLILFYVRSFTLFIRSNNNFHYVPLEQSTNKNKKCKSHFRLQLKNTTIKLHKLLLTRGFSRVPLTSNTRCIAYKSYTSTAKCNTLTQHHFWQRNWNDWKNLDRICIQSRATVFSKNSTSYNLPADMRNIVAEQLQSRKNTIYNKDFIKLHYTY